jgi:Uma2 family endonuclease
MWIPGNMARTELLFRLWKPDADEKIGFGILRVGHLVAPHLILEPDGAYTVFARYKPNFRKDPYVPVAPDIAIEVITPTTHLPHLNYRARLYHAGGTSIFWVIDGMNRAVLEYRPNTPVNTLSGEALLDANVVLPGFTVAVNDLFRD